MKRLWIAVAILALMFTLTLCHNHYLKGFTTQLSHLLTQAQQSAKGGHWEQAQAHTAQAYGHWTGQAHYLHIVLRHADIDDVLVGFHEVREFLACEAMDEYAAANARLMTEIALLYEAEALTLTNLL